MTADRRTSAPAASRLLSPFRQFADAAPRCAPTHAVSVAGNVLYIFRGLQKPIGRWRQFDEPTLTLTCCEGCEMEWDTGSGSRGAGRLRWGDAFVWQAGRERYSAWNGPLSYFGALLDPCWFESIAGSAPSQMSLSDVSRARDPRITQPLIACWAELQRPAGPDLALLESYLSSIVRRLAAAYARSAPPSKFHESSRLGHRALANVLERIHAELDRTLPLRELCEDVGLSAPEFCRAFKRQVGCSPHQYILRQRVAHSASLLHQGYSICNAAQIAGFADQPHLTRQFKRLIGTTPRKFANSQ